MSLTCLRLTLMTRGSHGFRKFPNMIGSFPLHGNCPLRGLIKGQVELVLLIVVTVTAKGE